MDLKVLETIFFKTSDVCVLMVFEKKSLKTQMCGYAHESVPEKHILKKSTCPEGPLKYSLGEQV